MCCDAIEVSLTNISISRSTSVKVARLDIHAESIFDKIGNLEGPPRTLKRGKSKEAFENVLSFRPALIRTSMLGNKRRGLWGQEWDEREMREK